jgi:putative ABC transport system permease protein
MRISAGYFETLKIQPQLGRWFHESEGIRGAPDVVILSDSLWRRSFSAQPDIIGKTIRINDASLEVVGIAPADLRFFDNPELHLPGSMPERGDVFTPIRFNAVELHGSLDFNNVYFGIARLKPGITPQQAQAELDSTLSSIPEYQSAFSALKPRTDVRELRTVVVQDSRKGLLLLLLSVGFVLLIACANVANLSLVWAAKRSREWAVRAALGASCGDLIRHSLAESFLIALAGTLAGSLLSPWLRDIAISGAPFLPRTDEITIDITVLGFAVGTCFLTAILFGLLPAWRASRTDPLEALAAAARGNTESLRGARVRALVIAAEVALGTVLVIGSGLLLLSFHRVMNNPRGFDGHDVLIADLNLRSSRYQNLENQLSFFRGVHDELSSIPGVFRVAANTRPPLSGEPMFAVRVEGLVKPFNELPASLWPNVSAEYFAAMRIPLREGRLFRDAGETEPVAVVSESAARNIWPGQDPIGQRLNKSNEPRSDYSRVIGVVGDVLSHALDQAPTPTVYRPYTQRGGRPFVFSIVVQAAIGSQDLAAPFRAAVSRFDPGVPVPDLRPMPGEIGRSVQTRLFQASLLSAFAFIAVLLATVGIYGVVSYSILQRRKEIGVRVALGADGQDIRRLVFQNGMIPVVVGLIVGLLAAVLFSRLMTSLLFQTHPLDPAVFITAPSILILAAVLPCWLTARQAERIDPMDALRLE